jgi:hypothetical protein
MPRPKASAGARWKNRYRGAAKLDPGLPTTRERPWMCHACGHVMDAASLAYQNDLPNTKPEHGDYSICIRCGEPHTRDGSTWRKMTAAELADMHPDNRRQVTILQAAFATRVGR